MPRSPAGCKAHRFCTHLSELVTLRDLGAGEAYSP